MKASTATYRYTFSTWSPAVSSVTGDATYTASFDRSAVGENGQLYDYFQNYNGTTLSTQTVPERRDAGVQWRTSCKTATAAIHTNSRLDTTPSPRRRRMQNYTAVFDSTVNRYRIVFLQAAGDHPAERQRRLRCCSVCSGTTPVKASSEDYDYVLMAGIPRLQTSPAMRYTAYFNRTSKGTTSALLDLRRYFRFSVEGGILRVENAAMNTPYALMDVQGGVLARGSYKVPCRTSPSRAPAIISSKSVRIRAWCGSGNNNR